MHFYLNIFQVNSKQLPQFFELQIDPCTFYNAFDDVVEKKLSTNETGEHNHSNLVLFM